MKKKPSLWPQLDYNLNPLILVWELVARFLFADLDILLLLLVVMKEPDLDKSVNFLILDQKFF